MLEFYPPSHAALDGTLAESIHEPILISEPSELVTEIQACVARMEKDAVHCVGLGSTARKQAVNAYNALADKINKATSAFSMDKYADHQIRVRYMDIINSSGQFAATLYTSLANSKSRASGKLETHYTPTETAGNRHGAYAFRGHAGQGEGPSPSRPAI